MCASLDEIPSSHYTQIKLELKTVCICCCKKKKKVEKCMTYFFAHGNGKSFPSNVLSLRKSVSVVSTSSWKKMCSHSLSCSAAGLNVRPVINLAKYSIVCVRVKKEEGGVGVVYLCVFTWPCECQEVIGNLLRQLCFLNGNHSGALGS